MKKTEIHGHRNTPSEQKGSKETSLTAHLDPEVGPKLRQKTPGGYGRKLTL
jgi:hypothetical protein